jgi:outer membrane protein insertion porin family
MRENKSFRKRLPIVIALFLTLNVFLNAQVKKETYQILGISVEGSKSADPSTIIANSGLKVNDEIQIPGDKTISAIRRLWGLKIFSDIQLIAEKKINNGVFLLIKVKEYPRIETAEVEGADNVSVDDVKEKISFVRGQILRPQDIFATKEKIKKLYEEKGYLNAKISPIEFVFDRADTTDEKIVVVWHNSKDFTDEYSTEYDYDPKAKYNIVAKIKHRVLLLFRIEEGDEVVVEKIEFVGNKAFDDDELKSQFDKTEEKKWWKFWSDANFKREDFEKDKKLLVDFYRKNGYRDFTILGDSLIYNKDKSKLDILIRVYEGPQYHVRNIQWEGNTVYSEDVLNKHLGFKKGDIYDYEKFQQNLHFNKAQNDVSSLYQNHGYLGFRLETSEQVVDTDSIDINIKVTEGRRFKIGEVIITGNDKTMDKVIRRELYTVPGTYFNRGDIFRSIQQLANLKYFNVEKLYQKGVDYRPANDSTVNLVYNVEEKSSDYLNASIGYSGSFGFSGAVGITLTNFSLSHPFKMGGGQVLNFNWQFGVGNYYRTFTLGFTEPWFNDTPTLVGFEIFDTRQRYFYDMRQTGGTVRVGRRLKWPDDFFYIQGMARFQYNDVIDGRNFYVEGLSRQYTLGFTLSRTDIDNPIFPSRGSKFSFNAELSGGPFLPGNVDYYKIDFRTDFYKQLFHSTRFTFYTGVNWGYIKELRAGTPINPFEFYFMGGNGLVIATTPLRGYDDRTVGPRNSNGDVIGGRVMAKYTAEIRAAATLEPMPIYFLIFAEAGNVFYNLQQTDIFDLKKSVGVGARILINPLGLIGFDFGYGFDRKSVDGKEPSWLFHFQFGRGF